MSVHLAIEPHYMRRSFSGLAVIRRNFVEVLDAGKDPDAPQVLSLVGKLYGIGKDLRTSAAVLRNGQSTRVKCSTPLVEAIRAAMETATGKHRPQSLMGKTLNYGLGHWEALAKYLENGRFGIDARCENIEQLESNAVRPVKLGAKNWLFFGSNEAGRNAAVSYTLVENCRRHGVPVEAYLRELLARLPGLTDPETIASLSPSRIAAIRRENSATA